MDQVLLLKVHEEALEREKRRREETIRKRIQDEIDKKERRRLRAEERKRRAEEERRAKLKEAFEEKVLKKADTKDNYRGETLSDIHGNGVNRPIVGLIGGPITELLLFFAALEVAKKDEANRAISGLALTDDNVSATHIMYLSFHQVKKLIVAILTDILSDSGSIDINMKPDIEALLAVIEEGLTLDKCKALPEEKKPDVLNLIVDNMIVSRIFELVTANAQEFDLTSELVVQVKRILATLWLQGEGRMFHLELELTCSSCKEDSSDTKHRAEQAGCVREDQTTACRIETC